jgi:hypothetical protein
MSEPQDLRARARRNIWLALIHVLIAAGFVAAFVWAQVHR